MRTYERTHPWISFKADLSKASPNLWVMLGECQSKCEHVARVPLRPGTARQLYQLFLAKGVLATTAIEGNTLSEDEVLQHIEGKLTLPPSRQYLSKEIDNIIKACKEILELITSGNRPPLDIGAVKKMNQEVLAGLKLKEGVVPGEIRKHSVGVGMYRGAPDQDCEYLLHRLCEWLEGEDFSPPSQDLSLGYAILKAIITHLYLAWIHPFGDGNGRTARLVEFLILISAGVPAASAHLLSNHYNLTRTEYYRQLEQASISGGDIVPFVHYAVEGFRDGLGQQIDTIWQQQWDIAWRNYVHEFFKDKNSISSVRRRHLVLDLSVRTEPVPSSELTKISPRIAEAYAKRTGKTLSRDVNFLRKNDLIVRRGKGYAPNRELILAFLPQRAIIDSDD